MPDDKDAQYVVGFRCRTVYGFISDEERAHLVALVEGVAPELWSYSHSRGEFGAWLPEQDGLKNAVLGRVVERARKEMGERHKVGSEVVVLRYREGDHSKPHLDQNKFGRHLRCGILLRDCVRGGVFRADTTPIAVVQGDAIVFRADEVVHEVTEVDRGERIVLTIGTIY